MPVITAAKALRRLVSGATSVRWTYMMEAGVPVKAE